MKLQRFEEFMKSINLDYNVNQIMRALEKTKTNPKIYTIFYFKMLAKYVFISLDVIIVGWQSN